MNIQTSMQLCLAQSNKLSSGPFLWVVCAIFFILSLQACSGINTYPMIARAGDTVSVMIGGSEQVRKDTISVSLQDSFGQTWDLQSLGLIRSVFNLRMDGRAVGQNYSGYTESRLSWGRGHETVQSVLVVDLPVDNVGIGPAQLTISRNVSDDNSRANDPFNVDLEIIDGEGSRDLFLRHDVGYTPQADLGQLEPAPHAKVTFDAETLIGAVSLNVRFNNETLDGDDINIYVPQAVVKEYARGFSATQRMVYWSQDGQSVSINVVAPQGISKTYLQLFILHPDDSSIQPDFELAEVAAYDTDGNAMLIQPKLEYFP